MRQSWSDDRLDDLSNRVDAGFARIDASIVRLDAKIDDSVARLDAKIDGRIDSSAAKLLQEMQMGFHQINARFDAMQQKMIRVGGGLIGVLVAPAPA
jgi:hypothetical protein